MQDATWALAIIPAALLGTAVVATRLRTMGARPALLGLACGLLIATAIGTRWSGIARLDLVHSATLLTFVVLGLSTMAWQTRKTSDGALTSTHRAATLALLMSASLLLLARPGRWPTIGGFALAVGALQALRPIRPSWREVILVALLALAPLALPAKFRPLDIDRVVSAFAAGSLVGLILHAQRPDRATDWVLVTLGLVAGLLPATLARLG